MWAYRTTAQNFTGETPFSITYEIEAMVPIKIEIPTFRVEIFNEQDNNKAMRLELDLIDEKKFKALIRLAAQKRKVKMYYNFKIKRRSFVVGIFVVRKVFQYTQLGRAIQSPLSNP